MPVVQTNLLVPNEPRADTLQVYNGLDCMITFEVHEALQQLFNREPETYNFERALQAPVLEMMLRGFKIDLYERDKAIHELEGVLERLNNILQRYAFAVWGKALNPRSPKQLLDFFYGTMRLPEQWTSQKGRRVLSTNRESLEKLEVYFHAMPIIATILAIRDHAKQLETLRTEIDPDGRMRTSYNIAGTETGRFSSSSNAYGTGGNLQNIAPKLRRIFIADPGKKLCGIDLEQAESREVGWLCGVLFGDWSYLDACESGDLHTLTAKLIWPSLPWTGDPKLDRALADQIFYREFSYRDMSKRGGHGSNYLGTPWTMSRHLKVPAKLMENFQRAYFDAFPGIPKWHRWVAQQLQTVQFLTTPFGRTRHFFGRTNDDSTLREAIAFGPQSSTADRMNLGLWRTWKKMGTSVELLGQVHDAIYFQYNPKDENEIIPEVLKLIEVPITDGKRTCIVPGEAKVGWNWGIAHDSSKPISERNVFNPDGLIKFKGNDTRERHSGLDRVM